MIRPYVDHFLKHNRTAYLGLKMLEQKQLICWRRHSRCSAGLFFVAKKDPQQIRMIIDAKVANRLFVVPPGRRGVDDSGERDDDSLGQG